jgi:hypothetical protein
MLSSFLFPAMTSSIIVWIHLSKEGGIDHDATINMDFHWLFLEHDKGFAPVVTVVRAYQRQEFRPHARRSA